MVNIFYRFMDFLSSEKELTSPRADFVGSRNISDAVRNLRAGGDGIIPISAKRLENFELGYDLAELPIVEGIDEFYKEKGIDYVAGALSRFHDSGVAIPHIYAHKRAVRFKDNYNSKK